MIEKKIEIIKTWCKNNKVSIFNAALGEELKKIEWNHNTDNLKQSFAGFIDFLTSIKPQFVILSYDSFDYSVLEDDFKSTIKGIKNANSNETLQSFIALDKIIKQKDGQLYYFELSFVDNGFCFSYNEYTDWSSDFVRYNEIIEEFKNIDYLKDRYTINDETLKLASELARFELFNKATNKAQRELAASLFFKDKKLGKGILYTISSIIEYADSINKMDIEEYLE